MKKRLSKDELNKESTKPEKTESDSPKTNFLETFDKAYDSEIAGEIGAISNAGMLDNKILSDMKKDKKKSISNTGAQNPFDVFSDLDYELAGEIGAISNAGMLDKKTLSSIEEDHKKRKRNEYKSLKE